MLIKILMAGFGGQGIMSMGQLLAYSGMLEKKAVAWIPSYGPEMRGGTANCSVTISTSPINSPVVTEPDILVAMNRPSLDKFEDALKSGGKLFINSSLINRSVKRQDIETYYVPANELAGLLSESKVLNMIMMGALLQVAPLVSPMSVMESLRMMLPESKHHLLSLNSRALQMGAAVFKNQTAKENSIVAG